MKRLMSVYHKLPSPARHAAATLRGIYLQMWRMGPSSARLQREALERDNWGAERWKAWREERLAYVLHRAATRVPYYRELWAARRRQGDGASWEQLENWPVLEKDVVRENPRAFVADDCDTRRMFHEQTSGTTGKPLEIWRTRDTVKGLYALAETRTRVWQGIPATARWARLGGQLVTPIQQRKPPFWVWNAANHQLYMSTFHLAPDLIPSYLDALQKYRIEYLGGYSSSLTALAQEAIRLGRTDLPMRAVFTNAEPIHPEQRAVITEAFHCPVRESYGMAESVAFASECVAGRLHQWPEIGHIEVMKDGQAVPAGTSGELICTSLLNADMPLIRYRVGDHGRLAEESDRCNCGRQLPLMSGIDGRANDMLLTRDGRQIFWLNPVFYGMPVRQSQIVQEAIDRVVVRVAPGEGFTPETRETIIERLHTRMGGVQIDFQLVDDIPRTAAGKLQAVVSRLTAADKEAVLRAVRSGVTQSPATC